MDAAQPARPQDSAPVSGPNGSIDAPIEAPIDGPVDVGDEDLAQLASLARDLAVEAGHLIVAQRPRELRVDTKSSGTDVVTSMDAAAETLLRQRLAQVRPGDAVFGEEGGAQAGTGAITWVLDPIDGTVNYLYGIPEYAVSVAAVVGDPRIDGAWWPVAGAVAHPSAGLVYSAWRGGRAYVQAVDPAHPSASPASPASPAADEPVPAGARLHVSAADSLEFALLGTGFGYLPEVRRRQAHLLLDILPRVRDIRRAGSAALDLCAVAAGRLDAYYEKGVHAWDYAAGWLLVTEAGGLVTGIADDAPGDGGVAAGGPGVHGELRALIRELGAG